MPGRLEPLEPRRVLAQVGGAIDIDTVWALDESPYEVTEDVTVEPLATLTIEPGVVVHFRQNTGLEVNGRLLAEGTPWQRITFDPAPGEPGWDGLTFQDTLQDSRIAFTDMRRGDRQGEAIGIDHSRLLLDHVTWSGTSGTILELDHPSLIVRNSHFPTSNGGEIIHGEQISGNEYLIIDGNTFANSNNGGDVIDFLGAERPGPVVQVLNNTFLGGGDDGLDFDGTDAHVEGNLFMNFRKNTSRSTTSNAIATGLPQNGDDNRTELTIVRNVFINNDHDLLLKEDAFATVEHNTFVGSVEAAIQFNEQGGTAVRGAGKGAALDGNIFWNNSRLFKNLIDQPGFKTALTVDRSLLPNDEVDFGGTPVNAHDLGEGNLAGDPLFVDADNGDFRLQSSSPASGKGPAGLDIGAYVESGPTVIQAISDGANDSDATFLVGGPGITHYRYRLDDGAYGALTPVELPIVVSNLPNGDYEIDVVGMNSAGEWSTPQANAYGNTVGNLLAPQRVRSGEMLPLVLQAIDWQGRVNSNLTQPIQLDNADQLSETSLQMKKGVGSAASIVTASDDFQLSVVESNDSRGVQLLDDTFPTVEYSGTLAGDTVWEANTERRITDDLLIPAGSTLTLQAGTRILLGDKVNLRVEGQIVSAGSADDPVLFNSINRDTPWGGIEIEDGSGRFEFTFMTNGGADTSRAFGHSNSQPVIMARDAALVCTSCFVVNNVGKAFGAQRSRVTIDRSVISDVDTGGEFSSSVARISHTWLKDISDGNRESFVDDDNDGFYFAGVHASGEASRFENSFVIDTKDDGLDHNGARLEVINAWIEGASHEALATSNADSVTITDSVFKRSNQGVEAGYGSPAVTVTQSVIVGNTNRIDPNSQVTAGLRFGDGYDGSNGAYEGQITAAYLVLSDNGDNVRNFDGTIPGPQAGAIDLSNSLTNDTEFDGQAGNLAGVAVFGSEMHLLRASAGFTSGPDGMPLGRPIDPVLLSFSIGSSADFNGDGVLNADDVDLLCGQLSRADAESRFDLNSDGVVDVLDRDAMIFNHLNSTYGDANLDGLFNSSDFILVFQRGEYEDGVDLNSGWADGDWNCDGDFSTQDLVLALQTGDYSEAAVNRSAIAAAIQQLSLSEDHLKGRRR